MNKEEDNLEERIIAICISHSQSTRTRRFLSFTFPLAILFSQFNSHSTPRRASVLLCKEWTKKRLRDRRYPFNHENVNAKQLSRIFPIPIFVFDRLLCSWAQLEHMICFYTNEDIREGILLQFYYALLSLSKVSTTFRLFFCSSSDSFTFMLGSIASRVWVLFLDPFYTSLLYAHYSLRSFTSNAF